MTNSRKQFKPKIIKMKKSYKKIDSMAGTLKEKTTRS